MKVRFWFIFHTSEPLAWSNELGWVSNEGPLEVYSDTEKATTNLPIDGKWVEWIS